jgi:lambda repressor-like predicted transcriptional regulator
MAEREAPEEIKWGPLVSNLRVAGWSLQDLAMETGFTVSQLHQMQMGDYEPPFLPIIKLLDLHLVECPKKHRKIAAWQEAERAD